MSAIPAKIFQEFHHFNQKKTMVKQKDKSCINCEKVPISKHYKNGF